MTEEERNLTDACDAVAKAIRERDYFQSNINGWECVRIVGYNREMALADREFVECVKTLCATYYDRQVVRAIETLKAENTKKGTGK